MNDDQHFCTVRTCKEVVSKSLLMCRKHWSMVPAKSRNAVNRTWRAWRTNLTSPAGLRDYEAARAEAIAFVNEIEAGAPV